jgi:transposase
MLGQNPSQPALFQKVDVESLVPPDHWLRQLDAALDLSFVRSALSDCYAEGWGRPSVDPELALRMMILGALYNLSDRRLCDEIRMHAGFRWFCRLNFHDPVPDHSTLSRLRNERWAKSDLFTRLFEKVLADCASAGMVSGRHVSVDGTQIRADASMKSLERKEDDPDEEPPPPPAEPQPEGAWQGHGERYSNATHESSSDPDARLYRKGKGRGATLSYLDHDLIDTKNRVILGRKTSLATSVAEREVALELLDRHEARREAIGLGTQVEILTGDTNYGASALVADLIDRGITPHVPLLAGEAIEEEPVYRRRTYSLSKYHKRLERIRLVKACNTVRLVHREAGYATSRRLRIRSEHLFAEAKNEHGLGRARYRGLERVDRQSTLVAAVQNLKRLSETLNRRAAAAAAAQHAALVALAEVLQRLWTALIHPGRRTAEPLRPATLPPAADMSPRRGPQTGTSSTRFLTVHISVLHRFVL